MRKFTFMILCMFILAQVSMAAGVSKSLRVERSGNVVIDINIDTQGLTSLKRDIDGKTFTSLKMDGSGVTFNAGYPELRTVSAMLAVPYGNKEAKIVDGDFIEIENISVIPSKGALTRNIDPEQVPYKFSEIYDKDEWYPSKEDMLSSVESFILRDISGLRVEVIPFQFNAKENKLRVYNKLSVAVNTQDSRGYGSRVSANISSDFEKIYSDVFMNYSSPFSRGVNAPEERKNLLIVAYDEFYDAVKPLADWKKKSGYDVELVKYNDIASNAEDLKDYFQNKYDAGDLCFITLVGEYEHIPCLKGKYEGANSDNMYVKLAGGDNIPDAFISRLSAKDVEDVEIMVNKTLEYEMNPTSGDWYKKGLGIASSEGTPKDYERCDELTQSLKNKLDFVKVWECYAPDSGYGGWYAGSDDYDNYDGGYPQYPGVPGAMPPMIYSTDADFSRNSDSKSIIFDAVNAGVSVIDYIGHGSDYSWVTSGFSTSDAAKLDNNGKYPVIWDVACVNGALHKDECFAESWMRTGTPERPAGAIGIVAGSTNESWVPPCDWQGEIIHNQLGEHKNSTANVVNMYGLLKVAEQYGATDKSEGNKLIEQKIYFGEGTVSLRTEEPREILAEAILVDNTIVVAVDGTDRAGLTVTAYDNDVNRTYTAVTDSRGEIEIPYEGQTMITVTGVNVIPAIDVEIEK